MIPFKPRKKKCRSCKDEYVPDRPLQRACSVPCAIALGKAKRQSEATVQAKAERAERRAAKEKVKRRSDYLREAQTAFNAYIRERDHAEPCISCQRHHQGQYHAGHYLSVGARPSLRFEPLNVWKQCAPCNNHLSGNAVLYRKALVEKLGLDKVEWLEGPHPARHYTVDEIKAITQQYRTMRRELVKARDGCAND